MESKIIELLSIKKNNNLGVKEIAGILGEDKEEVHNTLRLLGKEGIVYKNNNDKYILVSNTSLKKGTIKITSRKGAIVVLDNGTEYDVVYKDKGKLAHNDTVLVEPYNQRGMAKVVKIIDRKYYDYVAEVVKDGKNYVARCDGKLDIFLKEIYPLGTRLLISGEYNTVKEVIGHKDDPGAVEKEVLALNGFPISFSDKYLEEVSKIEMSLSEDEINEAVINNRKRMTYGEVNKYLEDSTILGGYEDYIDMLDDLYDSAMKVKRKMLNEGFLEFTSDEVKFFFENNNIIDIKERHQGKAEELIEFLMLLHNMCMTDYFMKNNLPFISRFHDKPNDEKICTWINLLKKKGYKININKKKDFTAEDIRQVQEVYKDAKEKVIYDKMAIMGQSKAKYSSCNVGHFALGMGAYSTGTSPIRRIADTINQRILNDAITKGVDYARRKWEKITPLIAKIATSSELRAIKAERKLDDIRKAEFMKQYEKQYFDVMVAGIYDNYLLVLYPDKMVYGKVFFNRSYYHVNKDGCSIYSDKGEKIFIGDTFNAKLLNVNTMTGEVVFFKDTKVIKEFYGNEGKKGKKKVKSR